MAKNTFANGVHPNDSKELTSECQVQEMPMSTDYFIGLSQHIGAPATEIVAVGDEVARGQLIATATGRVSANIFSSVSGKVIDIAEHDNAMGGKGRYIHIKAEGDQSNELLLKPLTDPDKSAILERIMSAGIVGMGGAGFPASVKDAPNKPVDVLIVNGAECEPYLNCDNRLMIEYPQQVAEGIKLLAKAIGVSRIVVGIEDNKMLAYEKLQQSGLEVMLLKKKYPQGAEKMLIYACTGRKVPAGGLPMDAGVVVHNVATAYAVYDAVVNGRPLYRRIVTVSGLGVANPGNFWIKNGTPHKDIMEFCKLNEETTVKILSGGPMMGKCVENLNGFTTKTESGLLALTEDEVAEYNPTPCIGCGRCHRVCPMNLMPMFIDFYAQAGDFEQAVKYGAKDCMECGCCAYACPAKRPIVQSVRLTKAKLKGGK